MVATGVHWFSGVTFYVGFFAAFVRDCLAAFLIAVDGFAKVGCPDLRATRITHVVLWLAVGSRVRFDVTCLSKEGFSGCAVVDLSSHWGRLHAGVSDWDITPASQKGA